MNSCHDQLTPTGAPTKPVDGAVLNSLIPAITQLLIGSSTDTQKNKDLVQQISTYSSSGTGPCSEENLQSCQTTCVAAKTMGGNTDDNGGTGVLKAGGTSP